MNSDDLSVQQLFQDRKQYLVPFYQRSYVWTLKNQWDQLWEDVKGKAEDRLNSVKPKPHFLGAIVLDPQKKHDMLGVETLNIIDGQQRLTTLQYLLKAVNISLEEFESAGLASIVDSMLNNQNPDTMRNPVIEVFKVWPTFRDREAYQAVMTAPDQSELMVRFPDHFTKSGGLRKIGIRHPPALHAVWWFTERIWDWTEKMEESEGKRMVEALANSISQDMKMVSILLGENDDAQVIFETLNGRGARLHATDLIRNFIFMRADSEGEPSAQLYAEYWLKFEGDYWVEERRRGRTNKPTLEWFIHAALQAELKEEIELGRLYFEYRKYANNTTPSVSAQRQLEMLQRYAEQYRKILDGQGSDSVARFGRRISGFDVTTVHPLALFIAVSGLNDEEKGEMFQLLFSYVVRRAICGLSAKNYNNVFMSLLRRLARDEASAELLRNMLLELKGETSRWPRNQEFSSKCQNISIYPGSLDAKKMRAVLAEIETQLRKDARIEDAYMADAATLDIDHILPQSWAKHWAISTGEHVKQEDIDDAYYKLEGDQQLSPEEERIVQRENIIPTLGNLTLLNLSVNREAQHREFSRKKDLLAKNTTLRLNVPLIALDKWGEEEIQARSRELTAIALKLWPGEDVSR